MQKTHLPTPSGIYGTALEIQGFMENSEETEENRDFDRLCRESEKFIKREEKNLEEQYKTEILAEIEKERQER